MTAARKKALKKAKAHRYQACTICHVAGHNKRTCKAAGASS